MKRPTHRDHRDLGLLALRLGTGAVLAAHGTQKLFGWFGGGGLDVTAKAMDAMGFRPGDRSALAAGCGEAGGGALIALGLATPAAGAVAAGAMAGAAAVHAPNGFFSTSGGLEYPGFLGWSAACLGLTGAGRYSLDHVTQHRLDRTWMVPVAFAASGLVTACVIRKRTQSLARATEAAQTDGADGADGDGATDGPGQA
ncbi:DoxX family protein [Streptomyces montanisoli]|uniref:DoxX family membrane protein n=1 Tax=Streptomyces montanisoli TaxID=2798581 RepID=A0A940M8U2_9ACTN|nr:DoxX family membrane protein [Streptomyces montanisoli]MBP0456422.1 DoxX family membrane protein [Streptomyces montanisoli]